MPDTYLNTIISILDILIWPLTLVWVLIRFKPQIEKLIERISNIKAGNISIDMYKQMEALSDTTAPLDPDKREMIKMDLISDFLKTKDELEKNKRVYEYLYFFERTYRLIFGTQLQILLEAKTKSSVRKTRAKELHEEYPGHYNYPFEEYIRFLTDNNLLREALNDDQYVLTNLGDLFLTYINNNNLPLEKPN